MTAPLHSTVDGRRRAWRALLAAGRGPTPWALPLLSGLALIAAAWAARDFLIPVVAALILSVLLWPAVERLRRWVRSRVVAALLAVLAAAAMTAGMAYAVGTRLSDTADRLPKVLQLAARDVAQMGTERARAVQRTRHALAELDRSVARATGTALAPPTPSAADARSASIVANATDWIAAAALAASRSAAGVLLQSGAIALLCFFLLCHPRPVGQRLLGVCRQVLRRPDLCGDAVDQVSRQVRLFAGVTLLTNIAIGVGVALGFAAFGVPSPWTWGLTAGALHFIPYAGLAIAMVLAAIEVYGASSSFWVAAAGVAYVGVIGLLVGTAMNTWLQGRAARVDSAWLFGGTLFWSVLWGGWGLLLGPLLVVLTGLIWLEQPAAARSTTIGGAAVTV